MKRIVITGASDGIGKVCAKMLLRKQLLRRLNNQFTIEGRLFGRPDRIPGGYKMAKEIVIASA